MENINEITVGKYAVGDKVIYNSVKTRQITPGKEYVIKRIHQDLDVILFEFDNNEGDNVSRFASRFLDNKKAVTKLYAVDTYGLYLVKGNSYTLIKETPEYYVVSVAEGVNKTYKKCRFTKDQAAIPVMPPPKPKAIFVAKSKGHVMKGVASYAMFYKDGTENKWHDDACHARLTGGTKCIGAYTWVKSVKQLGDGYKGYVEWMVFTSAWKECFVKNQTLDEIMEGGVELDITKPASVLFTACVMLRLYHEFEGFRNTWDKLIGLGFSENVVFLCAHLFRRGVPVSMESDWHGVITNQSNITDVVKSFKGKGFAQVSGSFNTEEGAQLYSRYASKGIATQNGRYSNVFMNVPNKSIKVDRSWGHEVLSVTSELSLIPVAIRFTEEFAK